MKLFPINHEYYINTKLQKEFLTFEIIKDISINKEHFEYEVLLQRTLNFQFLHYKNEIVLIDNDKIEKEFSFLIVTSKSLFKITIFNLYSDIKCNYKNYLLFQNQEEIHIDGLIHLEKDKNIIFKRNTKYSKISIYNDLFNEVRIQLEINSRIRDYLKINQNIFVISIKKKIKIISIINEGFIDEEITIDEEPMKFIYYDKKEKILFSMGHRILYLINFNCISPEVVQKIEINYYDYIKYINKY